MAESTFDDLERQYASGGADAVFGRLIAELRGEKKYHELFDALLMQARGRLGLPIILTKTLDELAEPLRSQVEDSYLQACREVGSLLLDEGRVREAWMYLRPVGDKSLVGPGLAKIEPNEDNLADIIEIALHEGMAPALGYRLVLEHHGTCNAITMFDSALSGRPKADRQTAAALLVEHLHRELMANVRSEIAKQESAQPKERTLAELIADREWLFWENNYHIDTTHLASTVRFARVLQDPAAVRLALDLAEYGRRLSRQFQFAGEEPFADVYASHALLFQALLGENVEPALAYFKAKAEADRDEPSPASAETYVWLLAQLGRYDEAARAAMALIPESYRSAGIAPTQLELSRLAGNYELLMTQCRQRGDLIGYTAGLLEREAGRAAAE